MKVPIDTAGPFR